MIPEDILDIADDKHPYDLGDATVTKRAALEAMEVYAKQEMIQLIENISHYIILAETG